MKQKTRKSISSRLKVTSTGKILKRSQLAAGHLRRNKSKSALGRHARMSQIASGEDRSIRKALGIKNG